MYRNKPYSQIVQYRVLLEANYYVNHSTTLREMETIFYTSKSTIHLDITTRLKSLNLALWQQCQDILYKNRKDAPYIGGEATHLKYMILNGQTIKE